MATIQTISVGSSANDGTGDSLRAAGQKINANDNALNVALVSLQASLSLVAFSNDYADLDNTPDAAAQFLGVVSVSAAADAPVSGTWRRFSNASGFLVVLTDALVDEGEAILQKLTGAGTGLIVAGNGKTINGATGVDTSTNVTDLVAGSSSGADVTFTSAGANLPGLDAGDYFELRNHSTAALNGWYVATGTPTTSSLPCTKLANADGSTLTDPADATSEAADIDQPVEDGNHLVSVASVKRIGTDFVVGGGTDADKDFDGSNLQNFGRPIGLVEVITGHIETVANKAYFLDQLAAYPYDVVSLTTDCESGTCSAAIEIDGTPVTGISAHSVSSTEATSNASAAKSVAGGATVELVLSSNSSCLDLRFTLKIVRT